MVVMGNMARRFKLGSELMLTTVSSRLGTTIHGRLDSGILYTAAYIARIKAQVPPPPPGPPTLGNGRTSVHFPMKLTFALFASL